MAEIDDNKCREGERQENIRKIQEETFRKEQDEWWKRQNERNTKDERGIREGTQMRRKNKSEKTRHKSS